MSALVNIIEENLTFIVIGLMIIVVVVLAYYTFIKPKSKIESKRDDSEESNQAFASQDSDNLDQTSKASTNEQTEKESSDENHESSKLEKTKPVIVQSDSDEDDTQDSDEDTNDKSDEEEQVEFGKYHIRYREKDNKWIVTREGSDKTIRVLHTKKEAIAYATIKAINQDTNIVIHGRDGKVEKRGY